MKRLRCIAALLCAAVLTALFPAGASAEGPLLTVEEAAGRRGETVTVSVCLQEAGDVASGGFNVVYDPAALELLEAETGAALEGTSAVVNERYAADALRVSFAGTGAITAAGEALRLRFRILESASFGSHAVTPEKVKLMNESGRALNCTAEPGAVTVRSVSVEAGAVRCAPGQDTELEILLSGDLLPCGGELELRYDPTLLPAAVVKADPELGGTAISLSSRVDAEQGSIRITWASARPIAAMGRLCSLLFTADEEAVGCAEIVFDRVSFFDETGGQAEWNACINGSVTFTEAEMGAPTLYMLGGKRTEEGTATVRILLDGAKRVCGGSLALRYDPDLCTPTAVIRRSEAVTCNPPDILAAEGEISLAWARALPPEDTECLAEIRFSLKSGAASPLAIEVARLQDRNGSTVSGEVYDGLIGTTGSLQKPILTEWDGSGFTAVLLDAGDGGTEPPAELCFLLAYYREDRLTGLLTADASVSFRGGIAKVRLPGASGGEADRLKLLCVTPQPDFVPVCEACGISLPA